MAQMASKTCDICVSASGRYLCQQCDQLFCQNCKVGHLRSNITKNHTFGSGDNIRKHVKLNCQQHNELFIYQCLQCDTQVCRICVVKNHNGHKVSDLAGYSEKLRIDVNEIIETKMGKLQKSVNQLEKGTNQKQNEAKFAINAIMEEGNRLKQLIDRKVEELVKKVKVYESRQLKTLTSMQEDFNTELEKIQNYKQVLKTIQDNTEDHELNKQMSQLKLDVEKLTVMGLPSVTRLMYRPKEANNVSISELFGSIDTRLVYHKL